jgi:hypothetical protein
MVMGCSDHSAGNPRGKTRLSAADLAHRRHAEICEALWRISTGLAALYQQGERRLKASTALESRVEGALQYFVRAWQATRGASGN